MKRKLISCLISCFLTSNPPHSVEAMSSSFFSPMTFTFKQFDLRAINMGVRQLIYAQGEITPGTAERFFLFLKQNDILTGETVELNSPGGSLADGMALGELIRGAGLNTEVGTEAQEQDASCYSSCTLAFLGGNWRNVSPKVNFGVHQFSNTGTMDVIEELSDSQKISGEIINYITSMGVSSEFFVEMSAVDPDHIKLLSQDELTSLHVITPDGITTWSLTPSSVGVYDKATTTDIRGTHKFIFACPASGERYPLLMALIEADQSANDVVDMIDSVELVFDGNEVPIYQNELLSPPKASHSYVGLMIALTPRLIAHLRISNTLAIYLLPHSHLNFFGFTANLSSGKVQLFEFLNSCGR